MSITTPPFGNDSKPAVLRAPFAGDGAAVHGPIASVSFGRFEQRLRSKATRLIKDANSLTMITNDRRSKLVQIAARTPLSDVRDQTVSSHQHNVMLAVVVVAEFLAGLPTGWEASGGINWRQLGQLDGIEYVTELTVSLLQIAGWALSLAAIAVLLGEAVGRIAGHSFAVAADRAIGQRTNGTAIGPRTKAAIYAASFVLASGLIWIAWIASGAIRSLALSTGTTSLSANAGAAIGLAIALTYAGVATFHYGWPAAVQIDRAEKKLYSAQGKGAKAQGVGAAAGDKAINASRRKSNIALIGDANPVQVEGAIAVGASAEASADGTTGGLLGQLHRDVAGYRNDISLPALLEFTTTEIKYLDEPSAPEQLRLWPVKDAAA